MRKRGLQVLQRYHLTAERVGLFVGYLFAFAYAVIVARDTLAIPLSSDAAAFAQVARAAVLPFYVPSYFPFYLMRPGTLYPTGHPYFYFWLGAIGFAVGGESGFRLVGPIATMTSLLGILQLNTRIGDWRLGLLTELILGSSHYVYIVTVDSRIESVVLSLTIWSFLSLVLAVQTCRSRWFIATTFLISLLLATKQQGNIVILTVILLLLLSKTTRQSLAKFASSFRTLTISLVLAGAVLSLFYFRNLGESTAYGASFVQPHTYGDLYAPYSYYLQNTQGNMFPFPLIPFVILGILLAPLQKPSRKLLLIFGLLNATAILFMWGNSRGFLIYLVAFEVVLATFSVEGLLWVKDRLRSMVRPRLSVCLGSFLVVMFVISIAHNAIDLQAYRVGIGGGMDNTIAAGHWLTKNSDPDAVVLAMRWNEVGYYSSRRIIWVNDYDADFVRKAWNSNASSTAHQVLLQNNVSFVWVDYHLLTGSAPAFYSVSGSGLPDWIDFSTGFVKVYENREIAIYKVSRYTNSDSLEGLSVAANMFGDADDTLYRSITLAPRENLRILPGAISPDPGAPIILNIHWGFGSAQGLTVFLFLKDPKGSIVRISSPNGIWVPATVQVVSNNEAQTSGISVLEFGIPESAELQIASDPGQLFYGVVVVPRGAFPELSYSESVDLLIRRFVEKHDLQVQLFLEGRILLDNASPESTSVMSWQVDYGAVIMSFLSVYVGLILWSHRRPVHRRLYTT